MRVAVYNRYWRTLGGGEKYSGFVAESLASNHEVDLLAHEVLDRELLKERLDIDLSNVGIRVIPEEDPTLFGYETSKYDLLVNTTFGSDAMCHATYGLYVCYFPIPYAPIKSGLPGLHGRFFAGQPPRPHVHLEWGEGWFSHEQARHVYRWSTERPTLRIWTPKGVETPVQLLFLRAIPKGADPAEVDITIDGEVVRKIRIEPGRGLATVDLSIRGKGLHPTLIEMTCNTFRPHELVGSNDPRHLGVALVADLSGRPANGLTYSRRRYTGGPELHFLESYDEIVAISQYTQKWMKRLWNRHSQILNPPVSLQACGKKEPMILSVGRFFDQTSGHSKKQAEMVTAFRALVDRGLRGWSYHLVGGCEAEHMSYLAQVRELAEGLPVEIHVGAKGSELKDLYSRASIFWHATGLGEKEGLFPERFEHFGITTVEAMSAGAVPVVIGKGGQLEIFVDGVQGRHFNKLGELIDITWEVAHDDELRSRLSAAAAARARDFGPETFRAKLNGLVEGISSR
jgi:glycosyltransferase involved in cell wall biosynthesis